MEPERHSDELLWINSVLKTVGKRFSSKTTSAARFSRC